MCGVDLTIMGNEIKSRYLDLKGFTDKKEIKLFTDVLPNNHSKNLIFAILGSRVLPVLASGPVLPVDPVFCRRKVGDGHNS